MISPADATDGRLPGPERRAQLLRVALEAFSERGFHETSMNEIASRAGVTKPVLYQHFDGKHALYLELVRDVAQRLADVISAASLAGGDEHPGEGRAQLENGLAEYFRFVKSERRAFALLFGSAAPRDEIIGKAVRAAEADIVATIAKLIHVVPTERDREFAAEVIAGAAEAAARFWSSHGFSDEPETLAHDTAGLLWPGLVEFTRPTSDQRS